MLFLCSMRFLAESWPQSCGACAPLCCVTINHLQADGQSLTHCRFCAQSAIHGIPLTSHTPPPLQVSSTTASLGSTINVSIDASEFLPTAAGTILWPFVNGSQWGSFVTCSVAGRDANADGGCTILLPLPRPGRATIEVAVLREGRTWGTIPPSVYPVGTPFPTNASDVFVAPFPVRRQTATRVPCVLP